MLFLCCHAGHYTPENVGDNGNDEGGFCQERKSEESPDYGVTMESEHSGVLLLFLVIKNSFTCI